MFSSQVFFKIAVACLLVAIVESRYLKLNDIPITPEGMYVRLFIKQDVKSGQPVASVKMIMEEAKRPPLPPPGPHHEPVHPRLGVPDFEDRLGIDAVKCPKGLVRIGHLCI